MSTVHIELTVAEVDALLSVLQKAEAINDLYYELLMTGRQADMLRPTDDRALRTTLDVLIRAQNLAFDVATDDERIQFAELLADRFEQPTSVRRNEPHRHDA